MSFDLGVWKAKTTITRGEADEIFARLGESDLSMVEPADEGQEFYAALTNRYPEIDDLTDDEVGPEPLERPPRAFGQARDNVSGVVPSRGAFGIRSGFRCSKRLDLL